MASPNFSDININLASAETTPADSESNPRINSLFDSFVIVDDDDSVSDSLPPASGDDVEAPGFNEMDVQTPVPISQQPPSESENLTDPQTGSSSSKRGRKRGGGAAVAGVFLDPEQFPDWVPRDWKVMKRARADGSSIDTYYYDPLTNRQLRSKREVLEFLENGSCTRTNRIINNKAASSKTLLLKNSQQINFGSAATPKKLKSRQSNTEAIPDKISWVHGKFAGWTPFIGPEMVPEHVRLEWQAMFNTVTPETDGCRV